MSELSGQVTHVEWSLTPLWWIPLLPLLGAVTNAVFGRRLQESKVGRDLAKRLHIGSFGVSAVAVGAMLVSFVLAVVNVIHLAGLPSGHRYLYSHAWQMLRIGSLDASFSFALDPLSAVMALVITGVGSLIHVYACAYMEKEPAYWRFFTYLNLFVFAMLLLVLGDNFIVMFFGWEGVGLASYLLIGFWYRDYDKASAGMKAFVVNRVGDWGFLCGLALLFWGLGGAWVARGDYRPDYRARFVAVAPAALSAEEAEEQAKAAHEKAKAEGGVGEFKPSRAPSPDALQKLKQRLGSQGYLTMTSHPGARVYRGVADASQFQSNNPPELVGISPFLRLPIDAGVHNLAVIPGGGAVVSGEGLEIAALEHVEIGRGEEKVILPIGPTMTFREIHDQLTLKEKDAAKPFLREALKERTVWGGLGLITLSCLLLFIGAAGKSAQIPLYVWLPDAMAGPTPVSALIHAATMVTAGVYLVARLNFLFSLSPTACGVVALIGAATALFAATIGFFQYDIKKVLAYSTVSQLGFMFIGVGVGAYWAGVFHLVTHAFFKACLFLASGSVIHGMHHVDENEVAAQDMRNMGGLKKVMPKTARAYFIACLAITAAPIPLLSGFWSKDEILWRAFTTESTGAVPGLLIYGLGLLAALCTSFYMWRSYYLTFEGPHARAEIATKVHESPPAMTGVLAVLAFFSAFAGVVLGFSTHFLGQHEEPLLEEWLAPVVAHSEARFSHEGLGMELGLMAFSVVLAIFGWSRARARYGADRPKTWAEKESKLPGFSLIQNKYYVDELYQGTVVRGVMATRLVLADVDRVIVDGIVNGVGVAVRFCAWLSSAIDTYVVDDVVNFVSRGVLAAGNRLRRMQSGRIQTYVYGLLGGVALLAVLHYFFR
ncbi:NADH-ubiquinone oxidoreductase chain L [Minicystis rosea]|nr:NADH-ubiquinone oxidoreductase chain L [Minicystis rosea]